MSDINKPCYQFGKPFDNIKIIFNSLVGDPRYHFKPINSETVAAHSPFDKDVFLVNTSIISDVSAAYAEEILGKDTLTSFAEYGKLFYSFGSAALTDIAGTIVKMNGEAKSIIPSEYRVCINKLGIAFSRHFKEFQSLINIKDTNGIYNGEKKAYLEYEHLIEDIEFNYNNTIKSEKPYTEFGEILSTTYLSLTIYLTGLIINLSEKLGIQIESLYADDADYTIETLGDRLISTNALDSDSKYKLISLIYTYYLMTKFYEDKLGIVFVDKINKPFFVIGEKISKLDLTQIAEDLDITYLTQAGLERNSKTTMLSILTPVCVITDPTAFDISLMNNEISDMAAAATALLKYIVIQEGYEYIHSKLCSYLMCDKYDASNVDILYNHFIENVADTLPHTVSPRYFFRITVYAAAFRFIKNDKSGEMAEQAAVGLYQAEAILTALYKIWFKSNYAFEISSGIWCPDVRRIAKEIKALTYVNMTIDEYIEFTYMTNTKDMSSNINNPYITYYANLDMVNSNLEDLSDVRRAIDTINHSYSGASNTFFIKPITEANYEEYDGRVKELNSDSIPFIKFFLDSFENSEAYRMHYMNEILENDYSNKALDLLSKYAEDNDTKYNTISDSKLSRALTNNISDIIKNEKTEDRFEMYFNVFIKYTVAFFMATNVFDKTNVNKEDMLGNTIKESEYCLPKLKSTRLFNFMTR